VLRRTKHVWRVTRDVFGLADRVHLGLISAGVAFFGMFSIFPALAALIAVFGLVADASVVEQQLVLVEELIPTEAYELIAGQINRLLAAQTGTLGLATLISIVLALWAARAGVAALIQGLNAINGRPNRSGLWHYVVAMFMTLTLMGICIVALLMVVVLPVALALLPIAASTGWLPEGLRWIVTFLIVMAALSVLYRFGPIRRGNRMGWFTPGAFLVVIVWVAASVGLSFYLSNFCSYKEVYGSIGAVIAMLMWLYISAYLVLMGAALNVVLDGAKQPAGALDATGGDVTKGFDALN
jgi:membrane protein